MKTIAPESIRRFGGDFYSDKPKKRGRFPANILNAPFGTGHWPWKTCKSASGRQAAYPDADWAAPPFASKGSSLPGF